jgi:hypothetical protein
VPQVGSIDKQGCGVKQGNGGGIKQGKLPPFTELISFLDKALFTNSSRLARIAFVSSSCLLSIYAFLL